MDPEPILRWLHVIGACVLLGTGAGIALFRLQISASSGTGCVRLRSLLTRRYSLSTRLCTSRNLGRCASK